MIPLHSGHIIRVPSSSCLEAIWLLQAGHAKQNTLPLSLIVSPMTLGIEVPQSYAIGMTAVITGSVLPILAYSFRAVELRAPGSRLPRLRRCFAPRQ